MAVSTLTYGKMHRFFLRTVASQGVLSIIDAQEILKRFNDEEQLLSVTDLVKVINDEIRPYYQEIKITQDEVTNEDVVVFLSLADDAATKAQNIFSSTELEYFRVLIEKIMSTESRQITVINAINLVNSMNSNFTKMDAQTVLNTWCRMRYFDMIQENYTLGVRAIHEFDGYFRQNMPHAVEECVLCKHVVFKGYNCPGCAQAVHKKCLLRYLERVQKWPCCNIDFEQELLERLNNESSRLPPTQVSDTTRHSEENNSVAAQAQESSELMDETKEVIPEIPQTVSRKRKPQISPETQVATTRTATEKSTVAAPTQVLTTGSSRNSTTGTSRNSTTGTSRNSTTGSSRNSTLAEPARRSTKDNIVEEPTQVPTTSRSITNNTVAKPTQVPTSRLSTRNNTVPEALTETQESLKIESLNATDEVVPQISPETQVATTRTATEKSTVAAPTQVLTTGTSRNSTTSTSRNSTLAEPARRSTKDNIIEEPTQVPTTSRSITNNTVAKPTQVPTSRLSTKNNTVPEALTETQESLKIESLDVIDEVVPEITQRATLKRKQQISPETQVATTRTATEKSTVATTQVQPTRSLRNTTLAELVQVLTTRRSKKDNIVEEPAQVQTSRLSTKNNTVPKALTETQESLKIESLDVIDEVVPEITQRATWKRKQQISPETQVATTRTATEKSTVATPTQVLTTGSSRNSTTGTSRNSTTGSSRNSTTGTSRNSTTSTSRNSTTGSSRNSTLAEPARRSTKDNIVEEPTQVPTTSRSITNNTVAKPTQVPTSRLSTRNNTVPEALTETQESLKIESLNATDEVVPEITQRVTWKRKQQISPEIQVATTRTATEKSTVATPKRVQPTRSSRNSTTSSSRSSTLAEPDNIVEEPTQVPTTSSSKTNNTVAKPAQVPTSRLSSVNNTVPEALTETQESLKIESLDATDEVVPEITQRVTWERKQQISPETQVATTHTATEKSTVAAPTHVLTTGSSRNSTTGTSRNSTTGSSRNSTLAEPARRSTKDNIVEEPTQVPTTSRSITNNTVAKPTQVPTSRLSTRNTRNTVPEALTETQESLKIESLNATDEVVPEITQRVTWKRKQQISPETQVATTRTATEKSTVATPKRVQPTRSSRNSTTSSSRSSTLAEPDNIVEEPTQVPTTSSSKTNNTVAKPAQVPTSRLSSINNTVPEVLTETQESLKIESLDATDEVVPEITQRATWERKQQISPGTQVATTHTATEKSTVAAPTQVLTTGSSRNSTTGTSRNSTTGTSRNSTTSTSRNSTTSTSRNSTLAEPARRSITNNTVAKPTQVPTSRLSTRNNTVPEALTETQESLKIESLNATDEVVPEITQRVTWKRKQQISPETQVATTRTATEKSTVATPKRVQPTRSSRNSTTSSSRSSTLAEPDNIVEEPTQVPTTSSSKTNNTVAKPAQVPTSRLSSINNTVPEVLTETQESLKIESLDATDEVVPEITQRATWERKQQISPETQVATTHTATEKSTVAAPTQVQPTRSLRNTTLAELAKLLYSTILDKDNIVEEPTQVPTTSHSKTNNTVAKPAQVPTSRLSSINNTVPEVLTETQESLKIESLDATDEVVPEITQRATWKRKQQISPETQVATTRTATEKSTVATPTQVLTTGSSKNSTTGTSRNSTLAEPARHSTKDNIVEEPTQFPTTSRSKTNNTVAKPAQVPTTRLSTRNNTVPEVLTETQDSLTFENLDVTDEVVPEITQRVTRKRKQQISPQTQVANTALSATLDVAITCDRTGILSKDVSDQVLAAIQKQIILEACSPKLETPGPTFNTKPLFDGYVLKLWCNNDHTVAWLRKTVSDLCLPTSTSLVVKSQSEIQKRARCSLVIPDEQGVFGEPTNIVRALSYQNPWVDIKRWALLRAKKQATQWLVVVDVPVDQIPTLMEAGRLLSIGLGAVYVKFQRRNGKFTDFPQGWDPATGTICATLNRLPQAAAEEAIAPAITPEASAARPAAAESAAVPSSDEELDCDMGT